MVQRSEAGDAGTYPVGTEVYAAGGEKVGEVVAVHPAYVVVEKGLFFPTDVFVPRRHLRADGDRLILSVTKEEAARQGWDQPPPGTDPDAETAVFPTGERVHLDVDDDAAAGR